MRQTLGQRKKRAGGEQKDTRKGQVEKRKSTQRHTDPSIHHRDLKQTANVNSVWDPWFLTESQMRRWTQLFSVGPVQRSIPA